MDIKKILIGLNVMVFLAVIIHYNNKQELTSDNFVSQLETPSIQTEKLESQEETSSLESYVSQILDFEFENTINLLPDFDAARESLYDNDDINPNDRHEDGFVQFKDLYTEEMEQSLHYLQYLDIKYYSIEYDQLLAFYMEPDYAKVLLYNEKIKKKVTPEYYVIYAPKGEKQLQNFIEYVKYSSFYPNEYHKSRTYREDLKLIYSTIKPLNEDGWYFAYLDKVIVF